jgi:ACS family tartrate transporter-like MFS transporter
MTVLDALRHPKVLLLTAAYFCTNSANYGFEFFLPSILQQWYNLKLDAITSLVLFPPLLALAGQLFVGWNSDRVSERRLHAIIPIVIGGVALALAPMTRGHMALSVLCFTLLMAGIKAYQPAFWPLPNLLMTESAAAGCIGLINSMGNLGGMIGPWVLGDVKTRMESFVPGIYFLASLMLLSATILAWLGLGKRQQSPGPTEA